MTISKLFIYQPITKLPIEIKDKMFLDNQGIKHDHYYGFLRNADVRSKPVSKGIQELNWRMVSLISEEELDHISQSCGIDMKPEWLGANIVVKDHPEFSKLPIGSRLVFPQSCILFITSYNNPCKIPTERAKNDLELNSEEYKEFLLKYMQAAKDTRGLVAIVWTSGNIKVNDEVQIILPNNNKIY